MNITQAINYTNSFCLAEELIKMQNKERNTVISNNQSLS